MSKAPSEVFIDQYDLLTKKHGDPVEFLFEVMADDAVDIPIRKSAASDLISYRYPKQKAVDITSAGESVSGLTFIFGKAEVNNTMIVSASEEFARLPINNNRLVEHLAGQGQYIEHDG